MAEESIAARRLELRPLLFAVACGLLAFVIAASADRDSSFILFLGFSIFVVPLVLFAIVGWKVRLNLSRFLALGAYWAFAAVLILHYSAVRDSARWRLYSGTFKSRLLAQPASASKDLPHVEWDGWGFAGAGDTTVYLVFDSRNSLFAAAKGGRSGKYDGLPCEVYRVRRLESQWYTVHFYTDEFWGRPPCV